MDVQTRSDRTLLTLIIHTIIRPFKPRLATPKKILPAGSCKLTPHKTIPSHITVVERQHPETAIWLYDLTSTNQNVHEIPKKKLRMYYFAGGGWQSPPTSQHWRLCAEIAQQVPGLTLTIVSPPLAPNSPAASTFPVLREFYDSLLLEAERSDERILLGGDSSGGNLALCLVLDGLSRTKGHGDASGASPAAVLAISPAVDLRPMGDVGPVMRLDPLLTVEGHNAEARQWAGDSDPANPWLSPLLSDVSMLVSAGVKVFGLTSGYDILTPSALEFRDACAASGVEGAWLNWERQMHGMALAFTYGLPEAKKAKNWVVEQLKTL